MQSKFFHIDSNDKQVSVLLQLAIFFNLFYSYYFFRTPFDFYVGYIFYIVLIPRYYLKYGIPKNLLLIFSLLLFIGVYFTITGDNELGFFLKVLLGAFFAYLLMYYIVIKEVYNSKKLFKVYLKFAFFTALFGIIQVVVYNLGIDTGKGPFWFFGTLSLFPGGLFGFRVNVFFGEPTYYAMSMSGALFVAIHDLIYANKAFYFKRFAASVVILGVYLSFSGTIVGSFAFIFILLALNYGVIRYLLIASPIALMLFIQLITTSNDLESRYDGTLSLFLDAPTKSFNVYKYHGSSVILYDHLFVAVQNFINHPLFGTGIGSHEIAYDKYSLIKNHIIYQYRPNVKDASSMFNRLLSETGLFGIGLFIFLIVSAFIKKRSTKDDKLWIISAACLVVIMINMARQGHYFLNGFPFYVWMYYSVFKERKNLLIEGKNNKPVFFEQNEQTMKSIESTNKSK